MSAAPGTTPSSSHALVEVTTVGSPKRNILLGLIGAGIAGSLTPAMHEREADEQGLRGQYKRIDLKRMGLGPADLPGLLEAAERMGFNGLNVTHPCKQAVLPVLHELSDDASFLGAANTVEGDCARAADGSAKHRRNSKESVRIGPYPHAGPPDVNQEGRAGVHKRASVPTSAP